MSRKEATAPANDAVGDLSSQSFRTAAHRVADMMADYLEGVGEYPVVPKINPGEVGDLLSEVPPDTAEPIDAILDDYKRIIEPNVTHWNHPGFLAYFAITGSAPGILGEALAATLNVNAMLWKTGPAPTELEDRVCDWLRQMIGLPDCFKGHINDTASISTMLSLAAARHRLPGLDIRHAGMAGRPEVPVLRVYCSEEAHSSVDKAAIALGFGSQNVRRVETDHSFAMMPARLERSIAEDRHAGMLPVAVVATAGTTSSTSIDPLNSIGALCQKENIWFHVDAAYAGSAAICPEFRKLMDGLNLADSVVLNPHKWLFTPVDCSVLFVRDTGLLRDAFSLVPEYLRTAEANATNLMDFGVQLGRRFRALKLWMVIRSFGVEGLRARIREHCRLARLFASWIEGAPDFECCAPVPFSTVCFRAVFDASPAEQDHLNMQLLADVNADGSVFLSHTKLKDRVVLRLTVGNLRTTEAHVTKAWKLIRDAASRAL